MTNDSNKKMIDLTGFGRKDVVRLCNMLNIKYNINGYGYVVSQSIKADTPITSDMTIDINLENKFNVEEG